MKASVEITLELLLSSREKLGELQFQSQSMHIMPLKFNITFTGNEGDIRYTMIGYFTMTCEREQRAKHETIYKVGNKMNPT